jgi:hypothetical protein
MLLITGVLSGPPWSSARRRSRGCTGTFEEPSPGSVHDQGLGRDSLVTFGAAFPDAFRSMPPGVAAGLPLLGLSTIAPPSYASVESTPGAALAGLAFGSKQPAPIVFRPRGFAPPRRLSPPSNVPDLAARLPTMGFAAFPTPAKSLSRDAPLPYRALLPRSSVAPGVAASCLGPRSHRPDTLPCPPDFTRRLASSPLRDIYDLRRWCHGRPRGLPPPREPYCRTALPRRASPCSPGLAHRPSARPKPNR